MMIRRRRPIRQWSEKRKAERLERERVIVEVLNRDNWRCRGEVLKADIACYGRLDVHEIIPRSVWRRGYLVPDNCVVLCRAHHDWVGDHPEAADVLGLHAKSWRRPW